MQYAIMFHKLVENFLNTKNVVLWTIFEEVLHYCRPKKDYMNLMISVATSSLIAVQHHKISLFIMFHIYCFIYCFVGFSKWSSVRYITFKWISTLVYPSSVKNKKRKLTKDYQLTKIGLYISLWSPPDIQMFTLLTLNPYLLS